MEVKYANDFVPTHEHYFNSCNFHWDSVFDFFIYKENEIYGREN